MHNIAKSAEMLLSAPPSRIRRRWSSIDLRNQRSSASALENQRMETDQLLRGNRGCIRVVVFCGCEGTVRQNRGGTSEELRESRQASDGKNLKRQTL